MISIFQAVLKNVKERELMQLQLEDRPAVARADVLSHFFVGPDYYTYTVDWNDTVLKVVCCNADENVFHSVRNLVRTRVWCGVSQG